jgi:hypothetical protein
MVAAPHKETSISEYNRSHTEVKLGAKQLNISGFNR